MQDGKAIPADAAGEWLREHFAGDPEAKIDITWRAEKPDPVAYRRILEILFAPRPDSEAA
jgi:hypothetical protein